MHPSFVIAGQQYRVGAGKTGISGSNVWYNIAFIFKFVCNDNAFIFVGNTLGKFLSAVLKRIDVKIRERFIQEISSML